VTSVAACPATPPVALALLSISAPVGAEVQIRHGDQTSAAEVIFERPPWAEPLKGHSESSDLTFVQAAAHDRSRGVMGS
jgi:hypothetical protein